MIFLLDTNILIYLIKQQPPQVAKRIDALGPEDSLAMSFITWAELLQGAEGSRRREATLRQLDQLARQVPVLVPDGPAICRHYAVQATALKRRGTPIGANDLWIACHVLALEATLVTHNLSEFTRIEGLSLEDWPPADPNAPPPQRHPAVQRHPAGGRAAAGVTAGAVRPPGGTGPEGYGLRPAEEPAAAGGGGSGLEPGQGAVAGSPGAAQPRGGHALGAVVQPAAASEVFAWGDLAPCPPPQIEADLALPAEEAGPHALLDPERCEHWLRRLFEKAIGGFYRFHLDPARWRVSTGKVLQWPITQPTERIAAIFSSMRADIVLQPLAEGERLVIDTKFAAILRRGWYRNLTLNAGYVYQIYAYLRSQSGQGDARAESAGGLLLHPAIDGQVEEAVTIQGHRIRFATVDLAADSATIRDRLLRLVTT